MPRRSRRQSECGAGRLATATAGSTWFRESQPIDALEDQRQRETRLHLDNQRRLSGALRDDVTAAHLGLHLVALALQEGLQRGIRSSSRPSPTVALYRCGGRPEARQARRPQTRAHWSSSLTAGEHRRDGERRQQDGQLKVRQGKSELLDGTADDEHGDGRDRVERGHLHAVHAARSWGGMRVCTSVLVVGQRVPPGEAEKSPRRRARERGQERHRHDAERHAGQHESGHRRSRAAAAATVAECRLSRPARARSDVQALRVAQPFEVRRAARTASVGM